MPYRTEHSCRLEEPEAFQKKTFRRISSGPVDIIIARPHGMKKTRAQAMRYPIKLWTENEARESCRYHRGKFEPAKPKRKDLGRISQRYYAISIRYPYERSFRWIGTVGGKPESERVKELYQRQGFHVRVKKL